MSLKTQDTALQSGVDFMAIGKAGAMNKSKAYSDRTYEFGTTIKASGATIGFGGAVVLDSDGGIRLPTTGDVIANIMGFAVYQNTGVIEDNGYVYGGLFFNVDVCELGEILLPVSTGETLVVGDTLTLNITSGVDFNTISKVAADATHLAISAKVRVAAPSSNGLVKCTVIHYAN
jgi:hypothetical protein